MNLSRTWTWVSLLACFAVCLHSASSLARPEGRLHLPLPGLPFPTSSFGERRATHLHAGIDLSTGGRIGMPVLAVDTCWVWRISVKNGGYGRALYVVLPDGEVALYGHLYRFASPMEDAVIAEQDRLGTYEVEIYSDPARFRFLPGDTVAFSGDTGAGPPHLHFELRSGQADHDDLNPLPDRLDLAENIPPVIRRVRITPLGPESEVAGNSAVVSVNPAARAGALTIAGPFGASVYATDVGLGERSLPPTTYEAWIDDSPIWRLQFDKFPFAKSHFVRAIYEPAGSADWVRLFDPYGLDLDGFDHYAPSDPRFFASLTAGAHQLRIKVTDVWGNQDQVSIPFTYGNLPDFDGFSLEKTSMGARVDVGASQEACGFEASFRRAGGAWRPLDLSGSGARRSGLVQGAPAGLEVLCRLTDPSGFSREGLLWLGGATSAEPAWIEVKVRPEYLEIYGYTRTPPSSLPVAEVTEGSEAGSCVLQPVRRNAFRGCYFLRGSDQSVQVQVGFRFGARSVEKATSLILGLIDRGRTVHLTCGSFGLELQADKDRTFRTFFKAEEVKLASYGGFNGCDGRLVFEPHEGFFENGLRVCVHLAVPRSTTGLGLFAEAFGRLSFLGAFDSAGACCATVYALDPLVVLRDTDPPVFRWLGSLVRQRDGIALFAASTTDGGSGIDSDSIRGFVDDTPAIASYDPDTGKINVRTIKPLPYGNHRLRLEAKDRLGNTGHSEIARALLK